MYSCIVIQIYPDPESEKAIMGSVVYCIHHKEGCKWSDELRKLKAHLNTCKHDAVPCSSHCGAMIPRVLMQDHLRYTCPQRRASCEFCAKEFSGHMLEVLYFNIFFQQIINSEKYLLIWTLLFYRIILEIVDMNRHIVRISVVWKFSVVYWINISLMIVSKDWLLVDIVIKNLWPILLLRIMQRVREYRWLALIDVMLLCYHVKNWTYISKIIAQLLLFHVLLRMLDVDLRYISLQY